ncbi:MAG: metallophosphoesterase family protein [Verrucomicrobia bacterium]|nr:metallophosphoesterase family protein [Verrucomicrobiota bacterium]
MSDPFRLGLISDTHNHFDPRLPSLLRSVDHILHAGDICQDAILVQLEQIAPVTAVLGNNDVGLPLRETEVVEFASKKFLIHHIVNPRVPSDAVRRRLTQVRPDVVVFGHSHQPFAAEVEDVFFINPGYAGRPRFNQPRSLAILELSGSGMRHEFLAL